MVKDHWHYDSLGSGLDGTLTNKESEIGRSHCQRIALVVCAWELAVPCAHFGLYGRLTDLYQTSVSHRVTARYCQSCSIIDRRALHKQNGNTHRLTQRTCPRTETVIQSNQGCMPDGKLGLSQAQTKPSRTTALWIPLGAARPSEPPPGDPPLRLDPQTRPPRDPPRTPIVTEVVYTTNVV